MSLELESQSAQSKIDSLQELNSQLIATIAELRKENAMLLDKEAGLMARIMELEQSAKENAKNAKLRDAELNGRIAELERSAKENEERFMKLE
jgi:cell division protein ZapA (FtsZ GTPase activity inhibitor)